MTQAFNLSQFANKLNSSGQTDNSGLQNSSVTITAGTGMSGGGSVSLGGSVTLTNAGVTSVNGQTGAVTISGGVSSVNGQTGAVDTTTFGGIGSILSSVYGTAGPYPSNGGTAGCFWGRNDYPAGTTTAGSNLYYNRYTAGGSWAYGQFNIYNPYTDNYTRTVGGRQSVTYAGGGSTLSGSWRSMSATSIWCDYVPNSKVGALTNCYWYATLWMRYA